MIEMSKNWIVGGKLEKISYCGVICMLTFMIFLNSMVFNNAVQADIETDGWETSTPEEQGIDSKVLNELKDDIRENYPSMLSMVIIRNGFLVDEEYFLYWTPTKKNIWSCTKSFISTLIGIAIHEGYIDSINDSVLEFFPSYNFTNVDERKQNMTIYHLLTMTSGIDWDNEIDPTVFHMWDSPDWLQFVLDREMVAHPGETYMYMEGAYLVLSAIITYATGMSTLEYAKTRLFDPLGIVSYSWSSDSNGLYEGGNGLQLTPRSLAKLGQLYLDNGTWDGQQIVPEEWVSNSTRIITPPEETLYPEGYGMGWWIHTDKSYEGAFSAWGYDHQRCIVYKKYQLVATFTANMGDIEEDVGGELVNKYILPAISDNIPGYSIPHLGLSFGFALSIIYIFKRRKIDFMG